MQKALLANRSRNSQAKIGLLHFQKTNMLITLDYIGASIKLLQIHVESNFLCSQTNKLLCLCIILHNLKAVPNTIF